MVPLDRRHNVLFFFPIEVPTYIKPFRSTVFTTFVENYNVTIYYSCQTTSVVRQGTEQTESNIKR